MTLVKYAFFPHFANGEYSIEKLNNLHKVKELGRSRTRVENETAVRGNILFRVFKVSKIKPEIRIGKGQRNM